MRQFINRLLKRFFILKRRQLFKTYDRVLPANELFTDRWEKANFLGFGKGTSVYDSACIFGNVKVGKDTWVGPYTILDGTGGLHIGDNCSISAGVHIYTHNTVFWALSGGKKAYDYAGVEIGNCCFIGPQSIIQNQVKIGNHCVLGANSFLNIDLPDFSIAAGSPAKIIGKVVLNSENVELVYF